jgi:hypothetical protein
MASAGPEALIEIANGIGSVCATTEGVAMA